MHLFRVLHNNKATIAMVTSLIPDKTPANLTYSVGITVCSFVKTKIYRLHILSKAQSYLKWVNPEILECTNSRLKKLV